MVAAQSSRIKARIGVRASMDVASILIRIPG